MIMVEVAATEDMGKRRNIQMEERLMENMVVNRRNMGDTVEKEKRKEKRKCL